MKNLTLIDKIRSVYFALSICILGSFAAGPLWVPILLTANFGIAAWQVKKVQFADNNNKV